MKSQVLECKKRLDSTSIFMTSNLAYKDKGGRLPAYPRLKTYPAKSLSEKFLWNILSPTEACDDSNVSHKQFLTFSL